MAPVRLPLAEIWTSSPTAAATHCFSRIRLALRRALVWVQTIAVSAGPMVRLLPASATELPVQSSVAS